jgi:Lrp/AsnC family transcriptional regulator, leucine-responsive regulatory protein
MKLGHSESEFDDIDRHILALLQENCKLPLAKIGEKVGLSAPSVIERIKKLEDNQVITGYHALLDARRLGKDVTAFIGVVIRHPKLIGEFEKEIVELEGVLECHHVTGGHTLLLKVKTDDTSTLEELISKIRSIEGVDRTETMVVLSTHTERTQILLHFDATSAAKRPRRNGDRHVVHLKGV